MNNVGPAAPDVLRFDVRQSRTYFRERVVAGDVAGGKRPGSTRFLSASSTRLMSASSASFVLGPDVVVVGELAGGGGASQMGFLTSAS